MQFFANYGLRHDCLTRYCSLAPTNKLAELTELMHTDSDSIDRWTTLSALCGRDGGIPVAAQLLRKELVQGKYVNSMELLIAHCWDEVIRTYDMRNGQAANDSETLSLAIAQWAAEGELPAALCEKPLQNVHQQTWNSQAEAVLQWGARDVAAALAVIDEAERLARHADWPRIRPRDDDDDSTEPLFSWWRLRYVSPDQYVSDCQLFRRMFQGETLCPAFLGRVPEKSPT